MANAYRTYDFPDWNSTFEPRMERIWKESEVQEHLLRMEKVIQDREEAKYYAKLPTKSTELVISYRVWRYKDGWLQSAYKDTVWPGYKPICRDIYEDMGIHGVKDYKKIPELMGDYQAMVAGSINMWGEVKEHEIGYLAEFAYPKELFVGPNFDPLNIMTLEDNYGVPVTIREELVPKSSDYMHFLNNYFYRPIFKSSKSMAFFQYNLDDPQPDKSADKGDSKP